MGLNIGSKSRTQKLKGSLLDLESEITRCESCPRLRAHCLKTAQEKKRMYLQEVYWGKPIPGFGDPKAKILIVGLAPAAHGANRTGRIFTGDRSGDWLFRALYKAGFASQPTSTSKDDTLKLNDVWITCVARCAPPDNKPLPEEIELCSRFLRRELAFLSEVKVVIALGQIALHGIWKWIAPPQAARPKFSHGGEIKLSNGKNLILSYHPSQQNTFTGRLTEPMFDQVFEKAKRLVHSTQQL